MLVSDKGRVRVLSNSVLNAQQLLRWVTIF